MTIAELEIDFVRSLTSEKRPNCELEDGCSREAVMRFTIISECHCTYDYCLEHAQLFMNRYNSVLRMRCRKCSDKPCVNTYVKEWIR